MRRLLLLLVLSFQVISSFAQPDRPAVRGLCTADEKVYFACQRPGARWISVCGAGNGVQYRFGRENRTEFRFPEEASDGLRRLLFASYFRLENERTELRFESGGAEYVVFDYVEAAGRTAGVRVTTLDGRVHEKPCSGPVASRLVDLKDILTCDADSALNGGRCS